MKAETLSASFTVVSLEFYLLNELLHESNNK